MQTRSESIFENKSIITKLLQNFSKIKQINLKE